MDIFHRRDRTIGSPHVYVYYRAEWYNMKKEQKHDSIEFYNFACQLRKNLLDRQYFSRARKILNWEIDENDKNNFLPYGIDFGKCFPLKWELVGAADNS